MLTDNEGCIHNVTSYYSELAKTLRPVVFFIAISRVGVSWCSLTMSENLVCVCITTCVCPLIVNDFANYILYIIVYQVRLDWLPLP